MGAISDGVPHQAETTAGQKSGRQTNDLVSPHALVSGDFGGVRLLARQPGGRTNATRQLK